MPDLFEKQFQLNGVTFGMDSPIDISEWRPGSPEQRSSSVALPSSDGMSRGATYWGSTVWGWTLFTNAEEEDEAYALLAALKKAWDSDDTRTTPRAVVPLRYRVAGQNRIVFGHPTRFDAPPTNESLSGVIRIVCEFELSHPIVFDDDLKSHTVGIVPPLELDAGIVVPHLMPVVSTAGAAVRETAITVGGDAPTPVMITIRGPVSSAEVRTSFWSAKLVDPVIDGDPVTLDASPWVAAATKGSGGGVRLNPRVTRISKLWLPPGTHEISFLGEDLSGAATATVSWRNARRAPR